MKKNKKAGSTVSADTIANLILLGAVLLAYMVYLLFFGRQPKEKPRVNGQPAEQSIRCSGDCGCCKCKDDPRGDTYEEPLWEY